MMRIIRKFQLAFRYYALRSSVLVCCISFFFFFCFFTVTKSIEMNNKVEESTRYNSTIHCYLVIDIKDREGSYIIVIYLASHIPCLRS